MYLQAWHMQDGRSAIFAFASSTSAGGRGNSGNHTTNVLAATQGTEPQVRINLPITSSACTRWHTG